MKIEEEPKESPLRKSKNRNLKCFDFENLILLILFWLLKIFTG